MTMFTRTLSGVAIAGLMAGFPLSDAFAVDTDAALQLLKSRMAAQGTVIDWTSAEPGDEEGSVTLSGVTLEANGEKTALPSDVEITGIEDADGGGYTIGELYMESYAADDADTHVDLSDISIEGLKLPPQGADDSTLAGMMLYQEADIGGVSVKVKGQDAFQLDNLSFELTVPEKDGDAFAFDGSADSFSVNVDALDDPQQQAVIKALGYDELTGSFEMQGSWQPKDGTVDLSQYDITVDDAGTIGLSLQIGGVTPEFIKSARQMQAQMAAAGGDKDNSAQGMAALGLMQQLTFKDAKIYFTDDTLTSKVLNFFAQQQGAKPTDIANQAKAMVPFAMMSLNNPQLSQQAASAVSAFLDDPKNIQIEAAPAAPVPFAMIAAGAMSAPTSLPQQLGVKIEANK